MKVYESVVEIESIPRQEGVDDGQYEHQIMEQFLNQSMYHFFITGAMKLHNEKSVNPTKSYVESNQGFATIGELEV